MAEYIKREEAMHIAFKSPFFSDSLMEEIEAIPSADVAPVRHGRWVMTVYTTVSKRKRIISNKKFACSECSYSNGRKQGNFCPNCGAKMGLEDER